MTIKDVRYVDGNIEARKAMRPRTFQPRTEHSGMRAEFFDPTKNENNVVINGQRVEQVTLIGALRNSNPNFEAWLRDVNDQLPDGPIMNQVDERQGPLVEMVRIAQKGWHSTMPDGRLPDSPTQEEQDHIARTSGRGALEQYMKQEFYAGGGYTHPTYNADHGHVTKYEVENLERFAKNFFILPEGRDWEISDLVKAQVKPEYAAFSAELLSLRDALSGRYAGIRPAVINETLANYRRDMNIARNCGKLSFDTIPRASGPFSDAVHHTLSGLEGLTTRHDAVPKGWRPPAAV